jgi:hypothetical protein
MAGPVPLPPRYGPVPGRAMPTGRPSTGRFAAAAQLRWPSAQFSEGCSSDFSSMYSTSTSASLTLTHPQTRFNAPPGHYRPRRRGVTLSAAVADLRSVAAAAWVSRFRAGVKHPGRAISAELPSEQVQAPNMAVLLASWSGASDEYRAMWFKWCLHRAGAAGMPSDLQYSCYLACLR